MISINKLSFAYQQGENVLNNISLSISSGERWSIIGKNGVGKSTLIRCIAGLEKDFSGSIRIKDSDVKSYPPRALAKILTYVPQAQGITIPFTVYDYIMMGRFPYQGFMASATEKDKAYVKEALELTDTSSFADRPMNQLSGGELQRVLLAGAVSQRTDILLLDEPATFLDPLHQELIHQTLDRIHDEYRCTIITVTHDVNTALFRYQNVLALVNGAVYYTGSSEKLLTNYSSALKDIYDISFVKGVCSGSERAFVMPQMEVSG